MRVFLLTTSHSNFTTLTLHWGIKPSQDQGHILPLKPCKAVLCFIFNDSHSSLHVYSFVWLFSPWEFWGFWLVDIVVLPMGCKPLQLLLFFL